jgi:lauroyl/myristoyl acyltransferase
MNFRDFATSEFGTRLWLWLGRTVPRGPASVVAHAMATGLSRNRHTAVYRAMAANQAIVRGGAISGSELDQAVRAVYHHAAMTSYDLVRLASKGDEVLREAVAFPPQSRIHIEAARADGRGVMLCGPHLSNFNLGFLAFSLQALPLQILLAAAPGGYQLIQQLVTRYSVQATQVSPTALRDALRRLRASGMVLTGVDWPDAPGDTEWLPFFGQPALLPTGHIRMAMTTNARLMCVAFRWDPGTGYRVLTAPPMELELTGDRAVDVRHNARRVLAVIEGWIAERPEQWLMYYPVWKDSALSFPA